MMKRLQTVVELPEFQRRAKAIMSDHEREAAINFVAANPEAGVSLGTAAVRAVDSGRFMYLVELRCLFF